MRVLNSSKEIEISDENFLCRIRGYKKLIIDLGTGQGSFVYFNAVSNKHCFYIGLDSCGDSMKKYSVKQYKNKVANLIYLVMNVQNIISILENRFSEIYINLPWGSLLEGLFKEEMGVIRSISKLAVTGCLINICFSYDRKIENNEIEKRGLPDIDEEYFNRIFKPMYAKYKLNINAIDYIAKDEVRFRSKWMNVLSDSRYRKFYVITGTKG